MQYTPTRTPPRRDCLAAAVSAADKGSALRRRAAEDAAVEGALRRRALPVVAHDGVDLVVTRHLHDAECRTRLHEAEVAGRAEPAEAARREERDGTPARRVADTPVEVLSDSSYRTLSSSEEDADEDEREAAEPQGWAAWRHADEREEPEAAEPQGWLQLICPWAVWRQ